MFCWEQRSKKVGLVQKVVLSAFNMFVSWSPPSVQRTSLVVGSTNIPPRQGGTDIVGDTNGGRNGRAGGARGGAGGDGCKGEGMGSVYGKMGETYLSNVSECRTDGNGLIGVDRITPVGELAQSV